MDPYRWAEFTSCQHVLINQAAYSLLKHSSFGQQIHSAVYQTVEDIRCSISAVRSLHAVISVWFTESTEGHITCKQDAIILLAERPTKASSASWRYYKSHWGIRLSGSVLHCVVFQFNRYECVCVCVGVKEWRFNYSCFALHTWEAPLYSSAE